MENWKLLWLQFAAQAAENAGHVWPFYAACEAAEESNYGQSGLAKRAHNLFGEKWHVGSSYGKLTMPTHEVVNGQLVPTTADFVSFPSQRESFESRMELLQRLVGRYPNYALALAAQNGEDFVRNVSATWSTDPNRGAKVLAIYEMYFGGSNGAQE